MLGTGLKVDKQHVPTVVLVPTPLKKLLPLIWFVKNVHKASFPMKYRLHPSQFARIVRRVGTTLTQVLLSASKGQAVLVVHKASTLQNQEKSLPLSASHVLQASFLSP